MSDRKHPTEAVTLLECQLAASIDDYAHARWQTLCDVRLQPRTRLLAAALLRIRIMELRTAHTEVDPD